MLCVASYMFHVTSGLRTTKHFFSNRQKGGQNQPKNNPALSQKHQHAFGENSKNRKIMSKKHTFHFISHFYRFYSNEHSMLKNFCIHIGIMIILSRLSQNVRFSEKADFQ